MAERVYPSTKPIPQPLAAAAAAPKFPATKAQTYGRPAYRPQPPTNRRRSRRSCWCSCCLWITLILVALLFLAAIAGAVFYVLYSPHRPSFTVSSLRLSQFNLTAGNSLTSHLDLSVTTRNPNSKISFLYDPLSVAVSSNGVSLGEGSFPAFVHEPKNLTVLKTTVSSSGERLDAAGARSSDNRRCVCPDYHSWNRWGIRGEQGRLQRGRRRRRRGRELIFFNN